MKRQTFLLLIFLVIASAFVLSSCTESTEETLSRCNGIVVSQYYGTGDNSDTPVANGYIQLYNTTENEISLDNCALYYSEDGKSYEKLALEGSIKDYYLIKAAAVSGESADSEINVFAFDSYDIEYGGIFDNKYADVIIAPNGLSGDKIAQNAICRFSSASLEDELSKNKVAVCTDTDNAIYTLYNLTEMRQDQLEEIIPASSTGANSFIRTYFNSVAFSEQAGFYDEEFTLTLSDYEGWDIYYTTNGSDPSGEDGKKYEDGILLKFSDDMLPGETTKATISLMGDSYAPRRSSMIGGRVIRAYATNGEKKTDVFTNTYFIIPDFNEKFNVMVMNMSLNVEDFVGEDSGVYYTYQYDIWNTRPRSTAYLEVFGTDGDRVGRSYIEFAVSGNGSSGHIMKSLRLYWKDKLNRETYNDLSLEYDAFEGWAVDENGDTIDSFTRLLIRNGGNDFKESYLRDAYCQRLATGTNVDMMAQTNVLVFINGEFWGVYNLRERYSAEYFSSHYGVEEDNVVVIENISPLANNDWNSDYVLAQGEEGDEQDFIELYDFIKHNDLSIEENYRYVESKLDIDSYIDYWVFECYLANNDWPGNNIKVWRNKNPDDPSGMDTKWRFCLLDLDFCLGLSSTYNQDSFGAAAPGTINGNIMYRLMKNEEFLEKLAARGYYLAVNKLSGQGVLDILDEMYEKKHKLIQLQINRWGNNSANFNDNYNTIRKFMERRFDYFYDDLLKETGKSDTWVKLHCDIDITVRYDTSKFKVKVNGIEITESSQVITVSPDSRELDVEVEPLTDEPWTSLSFSGIFGQETEVSSTEKLTARQSGYLYIK